MTNKPTNLDAILMQLGDFGKYQKFVFVSFLIAVILHSIVHIAYVFSAKDIDYRCVIPECDKTETAFNPSWLTNAVPYKDNKPLKCERFKTFNTTTNGSCASTDFDRNILEKCNEFVIGSTETTIINDFQLFCEDNIWKITLVGTINNIGQFVGLPISGIISDWYGRRNVLVWGMVLCSICGVIRAFSTSYIFFIVFEFLDAAFGAGTYACGFILAVELVGPSKRVLSGSIIASCYAVGEVIVALLAWYLQKWRLILLVAYIPSFLLLSYLWITPESIRWLLSKGKFEEANNILRKLAKVNKKELDEKCLKELACDDIEPAKDPLFKVFQSVPLTLRFINCCFCWVTCTFLFYGLTLNSVALAGNQYVDFILTSLVEIPAYIVTYLTVDRWGRKMSQCTWFLATGVSCFAFIFLNSDSHVLQLVIYLFGKFGATAAFTVIYVITSEIFPTPIRHSLMGACSMFGRIGSMVAPQMPLLTPIWKPLPLLLFGIMSTIAGFLSLLFPETLNTQLPDTIEQAENIGKQTVIN